MSYLFQDFSANRGNAKICLIMLFFRLTHFFAKNKGSLLWWCGAPVMVLYRVVVEWVLCLELVPGTIVGAGLKIEHGFALVVNKRAVLGRNVHLRHSTTIGCVKLADGSQGPSPVIGDNVEIGANCVILGGIAIGEGARVGAGSVVVKDVPPYAVVVGNPARVVSMRAAC